MKKKDLNSNGSITNLQIYLQCNIIKILLTKSCKIGRLTTLSSNSQLRFTYSFDFTCNKVFFIQKNATYFFFDKQKKISLKGAEQPSPKEVYREYTYTQPNKKNRRRPTSLRNYSLANKDNWFATKDSEFKATLAQEQ